MNRMDGMLTTFATRILFILSILVAVVLGADRLHLRSGPDD
jgi:hypothetical protein